MNYDKTRLSEYAAALSLAKRQGQTPDTVNAFFENYPGGVKGCVKAERSHRRVSNGDRPQSDQNESRNEDSSEAFDALRKLPAMGEVIDLGADAAEFVVAIGRRTPERPGTMEIVDIVDTNSSLVETILTELPPDFTLMFAPSV